MKNLMFIVLLVLTLVSFSKADKLTSEPEILYKTNLYTVYCIEGYKWLKWNTATNVPQQMFKENNSRSIPVSCR